MLEKGSSKTKAGMGFLCFSELWQLYIDSVEKYLRACKCYNYFQAISWAKWELIM